MEVSPMTCARVVLFAYAILSRGHVTLSGPLLLSGCDAQGRARTLQLEQGQGEGGKRGVWTESVLCMQA